MSVAYPIPFAHGPIAADREFLNRHTLAASVLRNASGWQFPMIPRYRETGSSTNEVRDLEIADSGGS